MCKLSYKFESLEFIFEALYNKGMLEGTLLFSLFLAWIWKFRNKYGNVYKFIHYGNVYKFIMAICI